MRKHPTRSPNTSQPEHRNAEQKSHCWGETSPQTSFHVKRGGKTRKCWTLRERAKTTWKGPWRTRGMLEGLKTELDLNKRKRRANPHSHFVRYSCLLQQVSNKPITWQHLGTQTWWRWPGVQAEQQISVTLNDAWLLVGVFHKSRADWNEQSFTWARAELHHVWRPLWPPGCWFLHVQVCGSGYLRVWNCSWIYSVLCGI